MNDVLVNAKRQALQEVLGILTTLRIRVQIWIWIWIEASKAEGLISVLLKLHTYWEEERKMPRTFRVPVLQNS